MALAGRTAGPLGRKTKLPTGIELAGIPYTATITFASRLLGDSPKNGPEVKLQFVSHLHRFQEHGEQRDRRGDQDRRGEEQQHDQQ